MSDDPQDDDRERESIWQPLDGSAPQPRAAEPSPLSFTKPEPRPLAFPAPTPAAPAVDPSSGRAVFVLGGWWQRLGAYVLDNLLFGFIVLMVTLPATVALGMTLEEGVVFLSGNFEVPETVRQPELAWAVLAAQLLSPPLIAAAFLVRWQGQTPGKRALGLRVVGEDGAPLTFGRAVQRELVAKTFLVGVVTVLTFGIGFLANYLWPLRDPQNRAGHDFFAKTRVVTAPAS